MKEASWAYGFSERSVIADIGSGTENSGLSWCTGLNILFQTSGYIPLQKERVRNLIEV